MSERVQRNQYSLLNSYEANKKQEEMRWVNMMSLYLNTGLYHIETFLLMGDCII